jgi:hypothetical protein
MHTGVALLLAAAFFGYMLALLQRRVLGMVSNEDVSMLDAAFILGRKTSCTIPGRFDRVSK